MDKRIKGSEKTVAIVRRWCYNVRNLNPQRTHAPSVLGRSYQGETGPLAAMRRFLQDFLCRACARYGAPLCSALGFMRRPAFRLFYIPQRRGEAGHRAPLRGFFRVSLKEPAWRMELPAVKLSETPLFIQYRMRTSERLPEDQFGRSLYVVLCLLSLRGMPCRAFSAGIPPADGGIAL